MTSVNSFPTRLLATSSRMAMMEMQQKLNEAQTESTTGRHHDIGLALGARMGSDIGLRLQLASIDQAMNGSAEASMLAETTQNGLEAIKDLADHFRSMLTGIRTDREGRVLGAAKAHSSLGSLRDLMSAALDGRFIFAGLASDQIPLNAYEGGPRQVILDAFEQHFGFQTDDPAAVNVTSAQLTDFIDGAFSDLFSDPEWSATWSSASEDNLEFRLLSGQGVTLYTSANAPFVGELSSAFAMIEVLGRSNINAEAFKAAVEKSLVTISGAHGKIADEQARIGIGQAQLTRSRASMEDKRTAIMSALSAFESVDPYEAATRVNFLLTQLEGSYALTGRLSRLSLLNYI